MKKSLTRIIGILLVLIMCFSAMPMYGFATLENTDTDNTGQADNTEISQEPTDGSKETADSTITDVDDDFYDDDDNYGTAPFSIMPRSAGYISHNRGVRIPYGSHSTSYYTADGNTAFCLDPNLPGMNTGVFPISRFIQRGTGSDLLIKSAYYLYGGPGYDSIKHNIFGDPDGLLAYAYSHAAISYVWTGNESNAFLGLDSATRQHLHNVISAISAQAMPPSGFHVFVYNEGSSSYQTFLGWHYTPSGHLEIRKASSNPSMSNNSSLYSLEGAVFDVFNGSNQRLGRITTDANGRGRLNDIDADQTGLYIVEVSPPKGFALNTAKIPFEIVSGQTVTVTVSNRPQNDPVGIILRKRDADTANPTPQGGALLEGAEFTIKYYPELYSDASQLSGVSPTRTWVVRTDSNGVAFLLPDYLVSGDPFYFAGNGDPTLPLGTITVQETKAPEGYRINSELFIRQITSDGVAEHVRAYNEPIVPETVIRGGVEIEKWDIERNQSGLRQGDATLAGAVFEIWNRSPNSVVVGGVIYAPNTVVHTMTTNANGRAGTSDNLLPYGSYEVIERTPPTGYLNTGIIRQSFQIRQNGVVVSLRASDTVIKNNVIRGGVEIEKWDIERNQTGQKQGDATLEGAVFEIWNRSATSVIVNGTLYAPNTIVHTMTTNTDGLASTSSNLLPYGSYEIIERTPPTGYLNTGVIRQAFQIRQNGVIVSLRASGTAIKNDIIRGGVYIEKWDNEIGRREAQGAGTLEGAVFEIVNRSIDSVLVLDELYAVGEIVFTLTTDSEGTAQTDNDLLPYGTYEIREISPPYQGYLSTGVLSRTFEIREHGITVKMNTADTAIRNNPIRGDLRGVKISDGNAHRMANVPFRITSLTTGESHVVITDKNGEFSTASSWNPHSQNTNRGETDRDGVWFGEIETLNDDVGALLFDNYMIEELRCEANEGRELFTFEVSVYRHNHVINLGTLTNEYVPVPEIDTTAIDRETTINSAYVSETTTIIDTVYYSGLQPGREYTVVGRLMDKTTGKPLLIDGEKVISQKIFRAFAESGAVTVEFTFSSLSLESNQVVVFQYLYHGDELIAEHTDIDDEMQTVTFKVPNIGTVATGRDGNKIIPLDKKVEVIDTVSYENLVAGATYTIKGILMDKETGKPVLVDGEEVTAETTFTATEPSGSAKVVFTFDSTGLEGKKLVVFEWLYYKDTLIAEHTDIDDEAQTVTIDASEPDPKKPEPPPPPKPDSPQTGRDGLPFWVLVVAVCASVAAMLVLLYELKIRKNKEE